MIDLIANVAVSVAAFFIGYVVGRETESYIRDYQETHREQK